MSEDTSIPEISFADLNLIPALLKSVSDMGYVHPSPIQAESIPHLLEGKDLLGQAQTGTGKTAAFGLPLLNNIDLNQRSPQALILAPTRELAIQVTEALKDYAKYMKGFNVLAVYGGQNIAIQLRELRRTVHVVVGTPGRIMDHLSRRTLKLNQISTVILDEADEMLRMGFIDDVETILEDTPEEKQVVLFSATMPDAIRRISKRYLKDPTEVKIKNKTTTVSTINQLFWRGKTSHKIEVLHRILEADDFGAVIVFVRTRSMTTEVSDKLANLGYSVTALNGDIKQDVREKTIDRLKSGKLDIIVATDVVARGLDVERISHVINYDMPHDSEAYVHRIGRTGRAGRKGTAIIFVPPRGNHLLKMIERATKQKIEPLKLPTAEEMAKRRIAQFKEKVVGLIAKNKLDFFKEVLEELNKDQELDPQDLAAALICLAQREKPLRMSNHQIPNYGENDGPNNRERKQRNRFADFDEVPMKAYRLEVGSNDGIQAGNIIGALTNEGNIEGHHLKGLKINRDYSILKMPAELSNDMLDTISEIRVSGQKLKIKEASESEAREAAESRGRGGDRDRGGRGGRGGRGRFGAKRGGGDRSGRGGDRGGRGGRSGDRDRGGRGARSGGGGRAPSRSGSRHR